LISSSDFRNHQTLSLLKWRPSWILQTDVSQNLISS
jgi:hypothetical protein